MKRILLLFLISITQITVFSQFEKVTDLFSYGITHSIVSAKSGNYLYVFDGYNKPTGKMVNLNNGAVTDLGDFGELYDFFPVEKGIFFITKNGASRNISFIDTLGVVFKSEIISNNGFGLIPLIFNQKLYITGQTSAFKLYECDGTINGTNTIFQSTNPLVALSIFDGKLIFVNHTGNQAFFYWMNDSGQLHLFDTIQINNLKSVYSGIGSQNGKFYFNVLLDDYSNSIQRMDTLGNGMELFIDDFRSDNIEFKNDSFLITQKKYPQFIEVFAGDVNYPSAMRVIPLSSEIQFGATKVVDVLPLNYYRIYAPNTGYELGNIKDGKLSVIHDLAKGPASSGVCFQKDAFYGVCDFSNQVKEYNGDLYSILSNGNNAFFYLYRLENNQYTSIVKVPNMESVNEFYIQDDYLYLIKSEPNKSYLERIFMGNVIDTQPITEPKTETWFRQLDAKVTDVYGHAYHDVKANPALIDEDGNVFLMVYANKRYDSLRVLLSNSDLIHNQEASNVLVKYNKYGEVKWVQSFGNTESSFNSTTRFTLDSNGDILIFDLYFKNGQFDDLKLKTSRVGYYVSKINGSTGSFVWVKSIIERNSVDFMIDGIVTDNIGNSYISFMYYGFSVQVSGIELNSDRSPVNALAKYDVNGHILWAKNMTTPWLNNYGRTKILEYSETNNSLMSIQTQGGYNVWSSCKFDEWGYFLQTINLEGDIIDTFRLEGDDLGSMTVGTFTNENRFFGMGYYRGELETGSFNLKSSSECESEGFGIIYDRKENDVLASYTTMDSVFYPFDMAKDANYIYVLGTHGTSRGYEYGELIILKFTHLGILIGYKELNQRNLDYDVVPKNYIDVKGDYIVVSGANYVPNEEYGINPLMRNNRTISLLKLKNENWKSANFWFYKQKLPAGKSTNEMAIYPNPFSNQITIYVNEEAGKYTQYEMFDIVGKQVLSGTIGLKTVQQINTSQLQMGAYIIKLTGIGISRTIKLIKANQ